MKKIIFIIVIGLIAPKAFSQADTSKPADPLVIKYMLSSDWNFTWGNLNSFLTVNQGQLSMEKRVIGFKLTALYRYGEIETVATNNEFLTNLDIQLFPKNRVYGFLNGGAEFSLLRGVTFRAWAGAGAGFKVLDKEDHKFVPTVAFNYEYTKLNAPIVYRGDSTDAINTANAIVGWTGNHNFFKGKLVLIHNFKWTQDMLSGENFRFNGGFTLSVPIVKNLSAKTGIIGSYQNVVPSPKLSADLVWTIGLAYSNF